MSIFNAGIARNQGEEIKKEDNVLNIHNNNEHGSSEIFTNEQIALFNNIVAAADGFFDKDYPESEKYGLGKLKTPIYLIPHEEYVEKIKKWCESDFVRKMREAYKKEIDSIPKNCPQEEKIKRKREIEKKYEPWICTDYPTACPVCSKIFTWTTPLGYYDPDENKIYICLDRIRELYHEDKKKEDATAAKVILHELAHALMCNPKHLHYETVFEYWAEESLANKIALKYIAVASYILKRPGLLDNALDIVAKQPEAYKFGKYLFEKNACDWCSLKDNKTNINKIFGNRWVDAACEDESTRSYNEVQRLFYSSFGNRFVHSTPSGFETWLEPKLIAKGKKIDKIKNYAAIIESPYFGIVFKEMMGWSYDTLADCKSSDDVWQLLETVKVPGSEEAIFHNGTYGSLKTALKHYYDYLKDSSL